MFPGKILFLCLCLVIGCLSYTPIQAQIEDNYIVALDWSSSGELLLIGYRNGDIEIYDATTNATSFSLNFPDTPTDVKWHPTDEDLFAMSFVQIGTVTVWSRSEGDAVKYFHFPRNAVAGTIEWGSDAKYLAVAYHSTGNDINGAAVWEYTTGDMVALFPDLEGYSYSSSITGIAWQPGTQDYILGVSTTSGHVYLYDISQNVTTLEQLYNTPNIDFAHILPSSENRPLARSFAWRPDGERLVSFSSLDEIFYMNMWDMTTDPPTLLWQQALNSSAHVQWEVMDRFVVMTYYEAIEVYDPVDGSLLERYDALGEVFTIDVRLNNEIAYGNFRSPEQGTSLQFLNVSTEPIANAGPDQTITDTDNSGDESVTLDGSGSTDSDGTIVSYVWTENSTQIATGATPTVDLAVGMHTITLTVTDDDGLMSTDEVVVAVNPSE